MELHCQNIQGKYVLTLYCLYLLNCFLLVRYFRNCLFLSEKKLSTVSPNFLLSVTCFPSKFEQKFSKVFFNSFTNLLLCALYACLSSMDLILRKLFLNLFLFMKSFCSSLSINGAWYIHARTYSFFNGTWVFSTDLEISKNLLKFLSSVSEDESFLRSFSRKIRLSYDLQMQDLTVFGFYFVISVFKIARVKTIQSICHYKFNACRIFMILFSM